MLSGSSLSCFLYLFATKTNAIGPISATRVLTRKYTNTVLSACVHVCPSLYVIKDHLRQRLFLPFYCCYGHFFANGPNNHHAKLGLPCNVAMLPKNKS